MLSLLLTCVILTTPETLEGKVVRIADGDTITVLVDTQQVRFRLSAIDAPETGLDFSQRSREAAQLGGESPSLISHRGPVGSTAMRYDGSPCSG